MWEEPSTQVCNYIGRSIKEAQFSTYQSIAYDRKMITDKAMWELMWEGSSTQVSTRASKMASMASSSPRGSEGESSAEEYDSSIENGMEKFKKDVNERNQEENNAPRKKKKRVAGDRSGRQLASQLTHFSLCPL